MPKSAPVVVMRKKDLHPEWFEEARVVCNGEEVLVTSGTKPSYTGRDPWYPAMKSL